MKNNRYRIAVLLLMVIVMAGGCDLFINVEPVSFSHEDEFVREGEFIVLADRRVFAVMAFMNVCGYDDEYPKKEMHPVRIRVRKAMEVKAKKHPEAMKRWKTYYDKRKIRNFAYQDYALGLSGDYPFKRIRPDSELGYDYTGYLLIGFPNILNEFWEKLEMEEIWTQAKEEYLADINKYDFGRMNEQLSFVWKYLRLERRDSFTFVSVPNLLDTHYHAIGANYENYWYMVENPGSGDHSLKVHEYLHSIINPLVIANYETYQDKLDSYFEAGKNLPMGKSYPHNITFAYECLVRAVDHRISVLMTDDPEKTIRYEKRVRRLTKDGLLLIQPFYQSLVEYEDSEMDFEEFVPVMLERLPDHSI